MVTTSRAEPCWSQELHVQLPRWGQEPLPQHHRQGAGSQEEQPGAELAPTGDASFVGGSFTRTTTSPNQLEPFQSESLWLNGEKRSKGTRNADCDEYTEHTKHSWLSDRRTTRCQLAKLSGGAGLLQHGVSVLYPKLETQCGRLWPFSSFGTSAYIKRDILGTGSGLHTECTCFTWTLYNSLWINSLNIFNMAKFWLPPPAWILICNFPLVVP